jgi:sugar lactone lactonase YvrE
MESGPVEAGAAPPDSGAVDASADCTGAMDVVALDGASCTATVLVTPISLYGGKAAGLALDDTGNLFVAENPNNLDITPDGPFVSKVTPEGSRTIFAGQGLFGGVTALKFDAHGYLYVADGIGSRYNALPAPRNLVWRVDPTGNATQFATNINNPTGLAFDSGGNLYVASFDDRAVYKFSATGTPLGAYVTGLAFGPYGITFDVSGNLFVTEFGFSTPTRGSRISKITPLGQRSTFVDAAPLMSPADVAFDGSGNLYASYYDSLKVLRIAPDGSYTVFPGGCSADDAPNGLALDQHRGILYTAVNGGRTTPAPAILKLTGIVPTSCE